MESLDQRRWAWSKKILGREPETFADYLLATDRMCPIEQDVLAVHTRHHCHSGREGEKMVKEVGSPSTLPAEEKKKPTIQVAQSTQVFFMIGCQRSGSNWLRTMLSEREDLIAPHPPHVMRDFMPKLDVYGDLSDQRNLKVSSC